jgi:molybdopterin-containing oxidoreductase family iron-sulfur binding subunit
LEAGVLVSTAEMIMEEVNPATEGTGVMEESTSNGALSALSQEGGYELTLYTSTGLGDGQQANNPWLQEFPDPITRASWDNYLTVSASDAETLGLENYHVSNGALNGSYVNITLGNVVLENVPVIIQPGQAKGSVGLALGYGKTAAIQEEMQTGVNAYPLYQNFSEVQKVNIEKAGGIHEFACVQLQSTMAGRSNEIIKETTLEIFNTKNISEWNAVPVVDYDHSPIEVRDKKADIWSPFDETIGHHFNLSIDLNACTGCGACVIACHAENNVPVVGKDEVRKFRDMHWLRIDRYYSAGETFKEEIETLDNLPAFDKFDIVEEPSFVNPQVAFQPVMCQHCNHAPCETVCPVAATSHGRQGQNHMAYNRCVGTRYCANNCPYKVRRFNWFLYNENDEFDYNMNNDLGRMVLNPDVVVRSRGVMEKCSMCIQMTQKTILDAKRDGRAIKDGEFSTACVNACETGAMVFGDVNDDASEIVKMKKDNRMYHLLESTGTKPNVFYQMIVKNTTEA